MSRPDDRPPPLLTPIVLKREGSTEPPADLEICYVLAGNGLFIHRRHRFFTSCVAAREWPAELAGQRAFLALHGPRIPRPAMERIVGFFYEIARLHGTEAAVILYWDRRRERVCFRVPDQRAGLTESWSGHRLPTDVRYEMPAADPDLAPFGSVHSHVWGPAYASAVDREDESHRTGLHVVVGRLHRDPPELHCEYVVDGARFEVDPQRVIEGYDRRRDAGLPPEWIARVRVDARASRPPGAVYGPVVARDRAPGELS